VWSSLRGLTDADLIERFRRARAQDYAAVEAQASSWRSAARAAQTRERSRLERGLSGCDDSTLRSPYRLLDAPEGSLVAAHLGAHRPGLAAGEASVDRVRSGRPFRHTRPALGHPATSVCRWLACIWLIRRFITPSAVIRYTNTPDGRGSRL